MVDGPYLTPLIVITARGVLDALPARLPHATKKTKGLSESIKQIHERRDDAPVSI